MKARRVNRPCSEGQEMAAGDGNTLFRPLTRILKSRSSVGLSWAVGVGLAHGEGVKDFHALYILAFIYLPPHRGRTPEYVY